LPYKGEGFYTRWIYLSDLIVCFGMDNCYNNFTETENTADLQRFYYIGQSVLEVVTKPYFSLNS